MRIPFMFIRRRKCNAENKLISNTPNEETRLSVIVMFSSCCDEKIYNSAWHGNDILSPNNNDFDDYTTQMDVDIVSEENIFVFDSDDCLKNYNDGLSKMKELWAQVDPTI